MCENGAVSAQDQHTFGPNPGPPSLMELGEPIGRGGVSELYAWSPGWVVKLFAEGSPPDVADAEARAARLAYRGGVRTPRVDGLVEVEGRPGIVMERVDGRPVVDGLLTADREVASLMGRTAAEVQATVHALGADGLPTAARGYASLVERCHELSAPSRRTLLARVGDLPGGNSLCHGDFHAGNLLDAPAGPTVIDWGAAHAGRPAADVAQTLVAMGEWLAMGLGDRADAAVVAFLDGFLARHLGIGAIDAAEVEAWRPVVAAVRLAVPHPSTSTEVLRREASSLD